eukprot:EG_transcript_4498
MRDWPSRSTSADAIAGHAASPGPNLGPSLATGRVRRQHVIAAALLVVAAPILVIVTAEGVGHVVGVAFWTYAAPSSVTPTTVSLRRQRLAVGTPAWHQQGRGGHVSLLGDRRSQPLHGAPYLLPADSTTPGSPGHWVVALLLGLLSSVVAVLCRLGRWRPGGAWQGVPSASFSGEPMPDAVQHCTPAECAVCPDWDSCTAAEAMAKPYLLLQSAAMCSITDPEACDAVQLEIMYLDALRMYYCEGRPAIDDELYDRLKLELKWQGSRFPTFPREKIAFLQRALQYARGKPEMSTEEYDAFRAELTEPGKTQDTLAFLESMKTLRRMVEAKAAADAIAMCATAGEVAESSPPPTLQDFEKTPGPKVLLYATQQAELLVTESRQAGKGLFDYLRLPPSQYSTNVLRARSVVRLGTDTFSCELEGLDFLGVHITPVLTARVVVDAATASSSIDIIDCRLKGRTDPGRAGGYIVLSQNRVSCRATADPHQKLLANQCFVQVGFVKPRWLLLPAGLAQRTGTAIIQAVLNRMTTDFLTTLEKDYQAWARDDPNRKMWVA